VVSTHLKNIRQNGNLPEIGMKIKKIFETTSKLITPKNEGFGFPW